ncbi:hypothetical protein GCM10010330_24920 [Streptomyces tendae]|nr:hypothetical protein GCM10010330_24920 [Streptomyces tendae]
MCGRREEGGVTRLHGDVDDARLGTVQEHFGEMVDEVRQAGVAAVLQLPGRGLQHPLFRRWQPNGTWHRILTRLPPGRGRAAGRLGPPACLARVADLAGTEDRVSAGTGHVLASSRRRPEHTVHNGHEGERFGQLRRR